MLASFTHHLRASRVPFYRYVTHWALFNSVVPAQRFFISRIAACNKQSTVLVAGQPRMPGRRTQGTEFLWTGGTAYSDTLNKWFIYSEHYWLCLRAILNSLNILKTLSSLWSYYLVAVSTLILNFTLVCIYEVCVRVCVCVIIPEILPLRRYDI